MLEIPGKTNHYICPSTGRVYSDESKVKGWLEGYRSKRGYIQVNLNSKTYHVHQLVAIAMYGDQRPLTVDHIDGDRSNNAYWNLRWLTRGENARIASQKLTDNEEMFILACIEHGLYSQNYLADRYGVSKSFISRKKSEKRLTVKNNQVIIELTKQ